MITLYLVGGCIRDQILYKNCHDYDIIVKTDSYDEMINYIKNEGGQIIYENKKYFTIKAKFNNQLIDFVLCRKDGLYKNCRAPEIVYPGTLYDDLSRRDFTMNALAKECQIINHKLIIKNDIIDYFGGIEDINNKIIKCVGNTIDRFKEDCLRLVRAFRFSIILNFQLSKDIIECLNNITIINLLSNISKERIQNELNQCFNYDTYKTILSLSYFPLFQKFLFNDLKLIIKIR